MAVTYRIAGWDKSFENNRTRELKHMEWVPIPNRMDGDGYTELLEHPQGAAHFGAWIALVEVASKCDPRGTLMRDGGKPHDLESLSRITRISSEVFAITIPRLIDIGWITSEVVAYNGDTKIPQEGAVIPQVHAPRSHPTDYGTERNGTERNGRETPQPPDGGGSVAEKRKTPPKRGADPTGFLKFWSEWPSHERKKARSKCQRFWEKHELDSKVDEIVGAVRRQKSSRQWTEDRGKYIPGPLAWLGDEGWEAPVDAGAEMASGQDWTHPDYEAPPLTPEQIAAIETPAEDSL